MKVLIELDVPEEFSGRNLYVLAGMDLLARSVHRNGVRQPWETKSQNCSRSGACCEKITDPKRHIWATPNGCQYLSPHDGSGERLCTLGILRPHWCCVGDGNGVDGCDCKVEFSKAP